MMSARGITTVLIDGEIVSIHDLTPSQLSQEWAKLVREKNELKRKLFGVKPVSNIASDPSELEGLPKSAAKAIQENCNSSIISKPEEK